MPSATLDDYRKTFLGACFGIGLIERGVDDNHVCFQLLVEDDENWFVAQNGGYSVFWLADLQQQLIEAMTWIKANCIEDPDAGWRFKDDPTV